MFGRKKKSNSKSEILPVKKVETEDETEQPKEEIKIYKILVYGIDKKYLQLPEEIQKKKFQTNLQAL